MPSENARMKKFEESGLLGKDELAELRKHKKI